MSRTLSLSVTLGNLRYDTHAMSCDATLCLLPRGGSATVRLPGNVRFEAAPGDDAQLDLDGGDGARTILKGKVRRVVRDFDSILATVTDAGAELAAYRPASTFEKQSASQIIRKLASDVSVQPGRIDLNLDLPVYVADPGRTASEHIAGIAALAGAIASAGDDGSLNVTERPSGPATSALRFGREFVEYETSKQPILSGNRFAIGFGPAGSSSAPDALRHSKEHLPSSAPGGGLGIWRRPTPVLRQATAASDASTAAQTSAAAQSDRLRARCFVLEALRAGDVVEVQDLPSGLSGGPWLITRVSHRIRHGTGRTEIEAEIAGAGSLLDNLLGALGGLL